MEPKNRYPEVLHNHFRYQHLVNDHNSKRHQPISLEVVWATQEWSCRPFAFLLAMMEVNVKQASEHFGGCEDKGMIVFHKQFAWELINNDYLKREAAEPHSSTCQHKEMDHVLISLPHGKKFVAQKWWFPSHHYPIHKHHVLDAMQRQDLIASVLQGLTVVNTASLNIVKTVKIIFELQTYLSLRIFCRCAALSHCTNSTFYVGNQRNSCASRLIRQ